MNTKTRFHVAIALTLWVAPQYVCASDAGAWEQLGAVQSGRTIRVESSQAKQTGAFVRLSDESITFHSRRDGEVTVPRSEVKRVYAQSGSRRVRNTIIGVAAGAAIGIVFYSTIGQLFRNEGGESAGLIALPIAAGTAIGAALPARRMVLMYKAPGLSGSKLSQ
jgi:hypothetical protein